MERKRKVLTEDERAELDRCESILIRYLPNSPYARQLQGGSKQTITTRVPKEEISYLYFARSGGLIKTGITQNINSRMSALQVSSPNYVELLKAIHGDRLLEKEIHQKFSHLREHGEWFREADDLISFINEVSE